MAWENGNNLFNYCLPAFVAYHEDNLCFYKALQLIQYYELQDGLPYTLVDLNRSIIDILGIPLQSFSQYLVPGIRSIDDNPTGDITWSPTSVQFFDEVTKAETEVNLINQYGEEIVKRFIRDITVFARAIAKSIVLNWPDTNYGLYLLRTVDWVFRMNNTEEKLLRITRADNEHFDVATDNSTADVFEALIPVLRGKPDGTK